MLIGPRDDGLEGGIIINLSQRLEKLVVGPLRIAGAGNLGLNTSRCSPKSLQLRDLGMGGLAIFRVGDALGVAL